MGYPKLTLAILLLLLAPIANAANGATGYLTVTVTNLPPAIREISINPTPAYADDTLTCNATAQDEVPERVTYEFAWYRNGIRLYANTDNLPTPFLSPGDIITCEATPSDRAQKGAPVNISVIIASQRTAGIKSTAPTTMAATGIMLESLAEKGLATITGATVKHVAGSGYALGLIIAILCILIIANILVFAAIRKGNKKRFEV